MTRIAAALIISAIAVSGIAHAEEKFLTDVTIRVKAGTNQAAGLNRPEGDAVITLVPDDSRQNLAKVTLLPNSPDSLYKDDGTTPGSCPGTFGSWKFKIAAPEPNTDVTCLFDGQLIDDELYLELSRFAAGVRVLVLSDSCHSGSVTRAGTPPPPPPGQRYKLMPPAVCQRVYAAHQSFYDGLQKDVAAASAKTVIDPDAALAQVATSVAAAQALQLVGSFKASVLLISGCQDNQTSMDGEHNGAFTEKLLRVWDHGKFNGNYLSFHTRIRGALPPSQSPNLFALGPAAAFTKQAPFTV